MCCLRITCICYFCPLPMSSYIFSTFSFFVFRIRDVPAFAFICEDYLPREPEIFAFYQVPIFIENRVNLLPSFVLVSFIMNCRLIFLNSKNTVHSLYHRVIFKNISSQQYLLLTPSQPLSSSLDPNI